MTVIIPEKQEKLVAEENIRNVFAIKIIIGQVKNVSFVMDIVNVKMIVVVAILVLKMEKHCVGRVYKKHVLIIATAVLLVLLDT